MSEDLGIEPPKPIEIPSNLDAWYENHDGPVVLVVQPRRGIGGQSSLVHMLQQPSALFFESVDAATDYHNRFPERFREAQKVSCYPVCLPPKEMVESKE